MMQLPGRAVTDSLPRFSWKNVFNWQQFANDLIEVAIIIAVSFVLYRALKLIVKRLVAHKISEEDPLLRRMREQRAQTLGSLFTNVALIVMSTITVLTVLSVFINIGPLLASVSVVGLAISFGAQSLVKDIISGTFILIEGQFGIGDVVNIGETGGLVEKMTLRTTVLRDLHGAVHVIPNGEIKMVSNLTKGWSRAVIDVSVAYAEDVDGVIEMLRRIGQDFQQDPQWAHLLLEPTEVLGVENLTETGVTVRMVAKTLPLKQWEVARELRLRIKKRFDEHHIELPQSRVRMIGAKVEG
ncbi:MAG TPA: mechanosensitive ion channel domain-containing protein [Longimicrobiales bacterium]|nr:mechanosensitive ion channel domain-containing protein [Longimicrobiales bacterium]